METPRDERMERMSFWNANNAVGDAQRFGSSWS